jgi:hypothetical protein
MPDAADADEDEDEDYDDDDEPNPFLKHMERERAARQEKGLQDASNELLKDLTEGLSLELAGLPSSVLPQGMLLPGGVEAPRDFTGLPGTAAAAGVVGGMGGLQHGVPGTGDDVPSGPAVAAQLPLPDMPMLSADIEKFMSLEVSLPAFPSFNMVDNMLAKLGATEGLVPGEGTGAGGMGVDGLVMDQMHHAMAPMQQQHHHMACVSAGVAVGDQLGAGPSGAAAGGEGMPVAGAGPSLDLAKLSAGASFDLAKLMSLEMLPSWPMELTGLRSGGLGPDGRLQPSNSGLENMHSMVEVLSELNDGRLADPL